MHLHIVRHGQTHWNAEKRIQGQLESELNDIGKQEAINRGVDFADMPLRAAYSSSSLRTRQTIQLILGERTDPVTYRDDLREVNLGIWQGNLWADIQKSEPDMVEAQRTASSLFKIDGAENSQQLQQRGVSAIERIIGEHPDAQESDQILIVSHGAIIKTILAHYTRIELGHLHHLPSLPNCAHCILRVEGDKRVLLTVAGTPVADTKWSRPDDIVALTRDLPSAQPQA